MKTSINTFLNNPELNSDKCYNFYDWFCKDSSLKNRMMKMIPKLRFLIKEGIIDGDTNYVWFKNNCPMMGSVYDDMRFSTFNKDKNFIGGLCPESGHTNVENKCTLWYFTKNDIVEMNFKNWMTFKKELKDSPTLKEKLIKGFKGEL